MPREKLEGLNTFPLHIPARRTWAGLYGNVFPQKPPGQKHLHPYGMLGTGLHFS